MASDSKFGLLRKMLRALGLSQQAADDVVNFIVDLLAGESNNASDTEQTIEFPYNLRDHFLSPAELSFFDVLRTAINDRAVLCTKVALGDVFWVKKDDPSRYRIYTNKIDRKHVDFLLCDPVTMRPLAGIELDDKSHQRKDRRERDAFVDQVFSAAGLPLLHIPVKRSYVAAELAALVEPFLNGDSPPKRVTATPDSMIEPVASSSPEALVCPKCGGVMVLRTARSGANAGNQFWGCSNYPNCRSVMAYQQ